MTPIRVAVLALLTLPLFLPAAPARPEDPRWVGVPEVRPLDPAARQRLARAKLEAGRALRRDGRAKLAEAALRRGLHFDPQHAGLHRELARVLEVQGRTDEAEAARALADALDPPPPPLPDTPLDRPSAGLLVVLVPPSAEGGPERSPRSWPEGEVARTLEERLALRLPDATVVHADFESVDAARDWLERRKPRATLSLRVDRAYCGDSVKDGRFALGWLRGAVEQPGSAHARPHAARALVHDPRLPAGCRSEATARALEELLALPSLVEELAAERSSAAWSRVAIRALFPGLGDRIDAQLAQGAALLAQGQLESAAAAFRDAARVDPEDHAVRTYLHEAEATLTLSGELSRSRRRRAEPDDPGVLDPRFSPAQRAALEAQLTEERRRREELLGALAVMDEDARLPPEDALATLRPSQIRDSEAFGPALARRRAGGQVEARGAYAPDGSVIARYYFPIGDDLPVLREEDLTQDGRADRWIAYAGSHRTEIWEAGRDTGRPDLRMVFTGQGSRLARIEVDRDSDGHPERIFHYSGDHLTAEARDTSGDGALDTFDRLDAEGRVVLREEDTNGDGHIDVRSIYEAGHLVRRELSEEATRASHKPK